MNFAGISYSNDSTKAKQKYLQIDLIFQLTTKSSSRNLVKCIYNKKCNHVISMKTNFVNKLFRYAYVLYAYAYLKK